MRREYSRTQTLLWRGGKLHARMVGASRGMDRAGAASSCRSGRCGNNRRTKNRGKGKIPRGSTAALAGIFEKSLGKIGAGACQVAQNML